MVKDQPHVREADDKFPYDDYLAAYKYPDILKGYENEPPLPEEYNDDNSCKVTQTGVLSKGYIQFPDPIIQDGSHPSFEVHIYYDLNDAYETEYGHKLHERIRREFPELRIFRALKTEWASHHEGMYEVNVNTPAQFGAFIPWLVINRGPLGCFMHCNTGDEIKDHIQRFTLFGNPPKNNMSKFTLFEDMTQEMEDLRVDILRNKVDVETTYVPITKHKERIQAIANSNDPWHIPKKEDL